MQYFPILKFILVRKKVKPAILGEENQESEQDKVVE